MSVMHVSDRRPGMTLRTRIALFAAIAVGISIAVTAAVVYFIVRTELYEQFDADLLSRTQAVGEQISLGTSITDIPVALLDDARIGLVDGSRVEPEPPDGGTAPPQSDPELTVATTQQGHSLRQVTVDGESLRVAAVPVGGSQALAFALPTESVDQTMRNLGLVLFFIGIFGVLGAAAAGYAVARAGLRPVAALTAAAERVARTEALDPIDVHNDDEIGRLAAAFNAMLASLDAARERERRLVADAGHELRTPLTSIRTNLDLLAQSSTDGVALPVGERRALLDDVRAQLAELSDLIGDLVQLSRDAPAPATDGLIDLAAIVDRSVERVQRRAAGVTFDVDIEPWWLHGDSPSLERSVINLLDNATKWSPPTGTVQVRLREGILMVSDEGPGIPEADRDRVFERFYRAPAARAMPGSGLGLAIVAQTAEQHGGQATASAGPNGGTVITLTLPGHSHPRDGEVPMSR